MKQLCVIISLALGGGAVGLPPSAYADRAAELNNQGIQAYYEERFEESVQQFTEALVERPDQPELHFNRGTALSATGKSQEALSELEKAAGEFQDSVNAAAAHFNTGNALINSGDTEAGIDNYKEAVKLDQISRDIRKNLELALRQEQEQQQQQQQSEEGQDSEDQSDSDNPPEQQNDRPPPQSQPEEQQQEGQEEQPMSIEEAQRILDAMRDEEKQALDQRRRMMQETLNPRDDW
ncbi:tetratricopeptide repeat protein [Candidatus Latescibacterota bacterium]